MHKKIQHHFLFIALFLCASVPSYTAATFESFLEKKRLWIMSRKKKKTFSEDLSIAAIPVGTFLFFIYILKNHLNIPENKSQYNQSLFENFQSGREGRSRNSGNNNRSGQIAGNFQSGREGRSRNSGNNNRSGPWNLTTENDDEKKDDKKSDLDKNSNQPDNTSLKDPELDEDKRKEILDKTGDFFKGDRNTENEYIYAYLKQGKNKENGLIYALKHGYLKVVNFYVKDEREKILAKTNNFFKVENDVEKTTQNEDEYISAYLHETKMRGDGLAYAAKNGYLKVVKFYVEKENRDIEKVDKNNHTTLFIAVVNHQLEIVKYLINKTKIKNKENGLIYALKHGYLEVVNLYVKDKRKEILAKTGNFFKVKNNVEKTTQNEDEYISAYLHETKMGGDALAYAAKNGYLKVVKFYVEKENRNIEKKDEKGKTTLFIAVVSRQLNIVEYLIKKGAKVDTNDNSRTALLELVVRNWKEEEKEKFIGYIENKINTQDGNKRNTVLHYASLKRDPGIVKKLLNITGIKVNIQNRWGKTPLHYAAENGYDNIVKLLLDNGADKNLKTLSGKTAAELAQGKGYNNIVTLIQNHKIQK